MKNKLKVVILLTFIGQVACSIVPKESEAYLKFAGQKNYVKTYKVYTDAALLKKSDKKNTHAKVNLKQQRIRLIVDGRTALDSPVTTGKKDFDTPAGAFKIIDKLAKKESNLYGTFYKEDKKVFTGSEKEYEEKHPGEKLEYDTYKGASLGNWLRLTRDGVGIHRSKGIYRRPASHGCIRVPSKTSSVLFAKLYSGSTVKVVDSAEAELLAKQKNKTRGAKQETIVRADKPLKGQTPAYKNKNLSAKERLRLLRAHNREQQSSF